MKKAKKVFRWQLIFMRIVPIVEKFSPLVIKICYCHTVGVFFIYLFNWNFILCDTLGVQFLVKFIGNSGH